MATGVLAVEAACKALSSMGSGGQDVQGGPPESTLLRAAAAAVLDSETPGMQAVKAVRESMDWPSTSAASKVPSNPPGIFSTFLSQMQVFGIAPSSMPARCPA